MSEKSLYIERNIGPMDQVVRIILGTALIIVPVLFQLSPWVIAVLASIGGSQIIEGFTGY